MSDAPVVENSNWWYQRIKNEAENYLSVQITERGEYVLLRQNHKIASIPIWIIQEFLDAIKAKQKEIDELNRKLNENSSNRS